MIKIGEAAVLLGLSESDKDKAKAREVISFFGVKTDQVFVTGDKGLKVNVYAKNHVLRIVDLKQEFDDHLE